METTKHATGTEIIEALAEQRRPSHQHERRRIQRHAWPVYVTVSWGCGTDTHAMEVLAQNISEHGLCFFGYEYPTTGTDVTVRFNSLPERPRLHGVVCYNAPLAWTFRRIGVEFRDAQTGS